MTKEEFLKKCEKQTKKTKEFREKLIALKKAIETKKTEEQAKTDC